MYGRSCDCGACWSDPHKYKMYGCSCDCGACWSDPPSTRCTVAAVTVVHAGVTPQVQDPSRISPSCYYPMGRDLVFSSLVYRKLSRHVSTLLILGHYSGLPHYLPLPGVFSSAGRTEKQIEKIKEAGADSLWDKTN